MIFEFELTGITPILFHADDVEHADSVADWRNNPDNKNFKKPGDDRTPAWTWMGYLHHDGEKVAIPSDVLMAALRHAATKIPMTNRESFKKTSQSGLLIPEMFCDFEGPKGPVIMADLARFHGEPFAVQAQKVRDHGFALWVKRVPVGQSKHVRVRPRFEDWKVRGRVEIIEPIITPDVLKKMFEIAGNYSGLLDYRPNSKQSPGQFGKFSARLNKAKHQAA